LSSIVPKDVDVETCSEPQSQPSRPIVTRKGGQLLHDYHHDAVSIADRDGHGF